jgi:hypothetical protein
MVFLAILIGLSIGAALLAERLASLLGIVREAAQFWLLAAMVAMLVGVMSLVVNLHRNQVFRAWCAARGEQFERAETDAARSDHAWSFVLTWRLYISGRPAPTTVKHGDWLLGPLSISVERIE